jgi:diaminopimelate decarboxylase
MKQPRPPRPFETPSAKAGLCCGAVPLEKLAKEFATPLYVYSADQIVERLGLFQAAFAGREHLVCYAVKANSALAILKLLADKGAGFDIVGARGCRSRGLLRRRQNRGRDRSGP